MDVEVFYSCKLCGLEKIPLMVRAREEEDIAAWFNGVVCRVSFDHRRRSFFCQAKEISQVLMKCPPGSTKIGGVSTH